jgi:hypothetical protein
VQEGSFRSIITSLAVPCCIDVAPLTQLISPAELRKPTASHAFPSSITCLHLVMSLPALTEAQHTLLITSALKGTLQLLLTLYTQLTPTARFALPRAARDGSYSPYSNFRVGAALLGEDETVVLGANVECASYGEFERWKQLSGGCRDGRGAL